MRAIQKGREPQSLTHHRATTHANYDNYQHSDELRAALVAEQHGICCYCMQRIRPHADSMKIEHWHCRDHYPTEQLDYGNLLGACKGNEGQPGKEQHCDTHKGNLALSRNPANPAHRVEELVRYLGDGRITSSDAQFTQELDKVLNLNLAFLINNRKAVLDGFIQSLPAAGTLSKAIWQKKLKEWSEAPEMREYCGVVLYWLRKKLK
jgi:uncharacterized protein (TIGR02646 family)